ncbi:MAG: hypothetical protein KatS3mg126_2327 [Lysobacteraceae bacterium]|nr:MAG: hypothetical protein KatS3mg126_2327 [Xanthomonadaceae bacterium]
MSNKQRLTLALGLALGSSQVLALGLGSIDVRTRLNEPLVAEIPILGSDPAELAEVKVRLAPPEAFARVGLDRPAVLAANLEFSIDKTGDVPVIRVTTPDKVRDPFLNFLLEVEWGRGRVLREYTVLLDPPVTAVTRVAPAPREPQVARTSPVVSEAPPVPAEPLTPPASAAPAPAPTAQPAPAPSPVEPVAAAPAPSAAPPSAREERYGPVRAGETLWSIAEFVRGQDTAVSLNQVMVALLAANPDAFIDQNIHRLKRGAVLRLPSDEEIRAISEQAAAAQVIEQTREWRARSGAVQQPASQARVGEGSSAKAPADARLELVPPKGERAASAQSGAVAGGEGAELRADLNRAREQVSALEQENRELRSRVADLEKLDADSKRLIQLKDSELAAAQARVAELEAALQQAGQAAAPAAEPLAAEAPAAAPAQEPVAGAADGVEAGGEAAEPLPEDALVDIGDALPPETPDEGSTAAEVLPAEDVQPAEAAPIQPPAEAEPAWYRNPLILGGIGGLLVLSGLFVWLSGRSRQKKPARPVRATSVADSFAQGPVPAAAATAGAASAATGEDAEAQALVDAIAEQPDDLGRHLALVRHYYEKGDASGFEGAAEAMYAQLFDPEDLAWQQVLAMGRELLPDHPLFAGGGQDGAGSDQEEAETSYREDLELADEDVHAPEPAPQEERVDWATSAGAAADAEPDTTDAWSAGDRAEDDAVRTQEMPLPELADAGSTASGGASIGDDFEGAPDTGTEPAGPPPLTAEDFGDDLVDSSAMAAELADPELAAEDAAATKLELARAYLDMGDVEGARGMLEEVVQEGNPGQRDEARRLLDEIR